jgi:diguanylate cyclase (GGDEF)-like protein/putative nucleotidyltransferase with HDIG domain
VRLPARLLAVVAPVSILGAAAYAVAVARFASDPGGTRVVAGAAAFLVASAFAERFPVPLEGTDANGVSLGFVFAVSGLVLFGWAPAIVLYATAPTIVAVAARKPPIRTLFNAGAFGLVGAVAGAILAQLPAGMSASDELMRVSVTGATLYLGNLVLVSAALAASGAAGGFTHLVRSNARWTLIPFALMTSTALMLVVLWQRTPYLVVALVGPLLAISLYQRSLRRALDAVRLSLTDPLTGLGNQRHFHERLQRELSASGNGRVVSLCLLDVDDFKRINDGYGHPAGDRVLAHVAARLRQGGEAFRLGGDEFAILLPDVGEAEALDIAGSIVERTAGAAFEEVGGITVSAGVATYPHHGRERDSLIRLADGALYVAKEHGKNQVRLARPESTHLTELRRAVAGGEHADRFRAATSLAHAVDARDGYAGNHSEQVAELAERIAEQLGLGDEQVELVRLAGRLHDVGKLAIPEEILRKPASLTDSERLVVQRHSQIGHRMLASLGAEQVADVVLHHHERWDGGGYPGGLRGDEIPLAARIVIVADAYDAMTAGRPYAGMRTADEAREELERCAGSQFDPHVVEALVTVSA